MIILHLGRLNGIVQHFYHLCIIIIQNKILAAQIITSRQHIQNFSVRMNFDITLELSTNHLLHPDIIFELSTNYLLYPDIYSLISTCTYLFKFKYKVLHLIRSLTSYFLRNNGKYIFIEKGDVVIRILSEIISSNSSKTILIDCPKFCKNSLKKFISLGRFTSEVCFTSQLSSISRERMKYDLFLVTNGNTRLKSLSENDPDLMIYCPEFCIVNLKHNVTEDSGKFAEILYELSTFDNYSDAIFHWNKLKNSVHRINSEGTEYLTFDQNCSEVWDSLQTFNEERLKFEWIKNDGIYHRDFPNNFILNKEILIKLVRIFSQEIDEMINKKIKRIIFPEDILYSIISTELSSRKDIFKNYIRHWYIDQMNFSRRDNAEVLENFHYVRDYDAELNRYILVIGLIIMMISVFMQVLGG